MTISAVPDLYLIWSACLHSPDIGIIVRCTINDTEAIRYCQERTADHLKKKPVPILQACGVTDK